MNAYKQINRSFQDAYATRSQEVKRRIASWRTQPPVARAEKPTNVARARELGYKAKQGVVIARVRVDRGLNKRRKIQAGRKPSKEGRFYAFRKSLQARAEERASNRFANCEVLNSYFVGQDGEYKFFEVILLDKSHPSVLSDPNYARVIAHKGRAIRGLTSAGKKFRGLVEKGFGTSRNRPSVAQGMSRRDR
ncbi:MAG: 50S ribosomal protein L15e [Candidatus Micrarchaeota archaeon]|nr:50S ribosomal protein L15e [Candidatus Micrarchaeota archaeon]